jgi:hypothetical protein
MVDPVVTDVEQTWVSTSLIGRWAQQSDFLCRVISQRKIMVPYFQSMSRKSSRHPVAECHLGRKLRCWFVQNQTFAKSHCVVNFWWFNKRKCQSFQ